MKIISVILARGGSKGIPNKNIIDINGKPLIAYTILASIKSKVQQTWVSTDSDKIKKTANSYGALTLDRPKEISGDFSQSEEALIHFSHNIDFDILVFIQPTSPLIKSKDLNNGIEMITNSNTPLDSVFSVYKEHWVPRWDLNIKPSNWDINNRPMRQEVNDKYVENGAFYITTRESLLKSNLRYSGKLGIVEMPISRSFQIDSTDDIKLIRKLL